MFVALALTLTFAADTPEAKKLTPQPTRYSAYWLTNTVGANEHVKLLITRLPLPELKKELKERETILTLRPKEAFLTPILDLPAITITTSNKDSIWNDGVPLQAAHNFRELDEKERKLELGGVSYTYGECPLSDVVRLLKNPEGKQPLHRKLAPLAGMEQTARGLRLLLEEQLKEETRK